LIRAADLPPSPESIERFKPASTRHNRIALVLQTDDAKLKQAIRVHRDYIANETLVVNWATGPLGGLSHRVEVKIEGAKLTIELKKSIE
jgi:hypothetical protein